VAKHKKRRRRQSADEIHRKTPDRPIQVGPAKVPAFWRFLVATSVIITIAAGLFSFKPRIKIHRPSASADTPSGQVFGISNDGWLPLRNIIIRPSEVLTTKPLAIPGYPPGSQLQYQFDAMPVQANRLASGQNLSVRLVSMHDLRKIAVEFWLRYDAWWVPHHHAERSRYVTYLDVDGQLDWEECTPANCAESDFTLPSGAKTVPFHPEGMLGDTPVWSVTQTLPAR
jgi:hypothetical protein